MPENMPAEFAELWSRFLEGEALWCEVEEAIAAYKAAQ